MLFCYFVDLIELKLFGINLVMVIFILGFRGNKFLKIGKFKNNNL